MNKMPTENTVALSDKTIKAIQPAEKPKKVAVENGLYLYVSPQGTKSWRFDFRVGGKRATLTFGKYPDVTLGVARKKHLEARAKLANGENPAQEKRVQKLIRKGQQNNTFDAVADEWYSSKDARRSKVWQETHKLYMKRDLSPVIGSLPLAEITPEILLGALEATKKRSGIVTADRVRQTAVQVFEFGKRKFKVTSNVARSLADWTRGEMPQKKNRPWIPANELPKFLDAVDAYRGNDTTKYAVYLLLLFFVRKQELIEAKWAEFDLEGGLWVVPAARMKMPTEQKANRHNGHEVPLSTQAIKILQDLKPYCSGSEYLFPSNSSLDKPIGHSTLNVMFKRMGYAGTFTPHGVRATASTILNEKGFRPDVIERQLAHVERSSVRRAYNHAQHRDERRVMMQAWADYIDEIRIAAS